MNFSENSSLKKLYDLLKTFHLSEGLYVIGSVNAALKYGSKVSTNKDIPKWIMKWLNLRGRNERERQSIILTMTRMARFLLLSTANDHKGVFLDLNNKKFIQAANIIGDIDFIENDPMISETMDKFSLYFSRTFQIQLPLQASKKHLLGRGYLLYIKTLKETPTDYPFEEKFYEYFGLTLLEFMSTGFAMWIMSNGTLDYNLNIEVNNLKSLITTETQRIFLSLSSGTAKQYREMIRGKDWKTPDQLKDRFALDPFTSIPAIKVERSAKLGLDSYVVPQPKYLMDRASSGIFYLLADKERELALLNGKIGQNSFRNAFGIIFRKYVGKHLSLKGQHKFIDLDDDIKYNGGKIPDFAIIHNNVCLLFEVKTTLLNIDARTYFEIEKLENEVRNGNIRKAIRQVKAFEKVILSYQTGDPRFEAIDKVINIIVGYDDIYSLNSTLLPTLDRVESEVQYNLQFASITDIESISSAIDAGSNIVDLLYNKAKHDQKRFWSIATLFYDIDSPDNSILDNAYDEFVSKMG
ncbi:MAG: hypothetical protein ACN6PN_02540 [Sphingobacterium sp.]